MKRIISLLLGFVLVHVLCAADYELIINMYANSTFRPTYDYCGLVYGLYPSSYDYDGTVNIPGTAAAGNAIGMVYGIKSDAFDGSAITGLDISANSQRINYLGSCPSLKKLC